MKRIIINILSSIFQAVDTLLCKLHIKRPVVIMYVDGGICSQMFQFIQGQYYKAVADVYYDIRWFEIRGKDQFGVHSRIFEFTEMWPNLEYHVISKFRRKWYLLFFKANRMSGDVLPTPSTIKHSLYLDGWWDFPKGESARLYKKCFDLNIAAVPTIAKTSVFNNVVGIHVRRGDLAKGDNPIYGGVTDGYFLRAIEFCNEKFKPAKYIFFSDEPDWVEQNICNHLEQPYEIMRGNKAWEDLWLLAQCQVIVASQGSFGTMAARLNPDAVLIQCDNEHANREIKNTYFVK